MAFIRGSYAANGLTTKLQPPQRYKLQPTKYLPTILIYSPPGPAYADLSNRVPAPTAHMQSKTYQSWVHVNYGTLQAFKPSDNPTSRARVACPRVSDWGVHLHRNGIANSSHLSYLPSAAQPTARRLTSPSQAWWPPTMSCPSACLGGGC